MPGLPRPLPVVCLIAPLVATAAAAAIGPSDLLSYAPAAGVGRLQPRIHAVPPATKPLYPIHSRALRNPQPTPPQAVTVPPPPPPPITASLPSLGAPGTWLAAALGAASAVALLGWLLRWMLLGARGVGGPWATVGYYGRGFQKAGQMTDEQAWLVANGLVVVKDKPNRDRWSPSQLEGEVPDPSEVPHPDVQRSGRYPSTPGSGTWGLPLPGYRGWGVEEPADPQTQEYYDPGRPIFLDEALAYLDIKDGMRFLDVSFRDGAYTRAILATADCHVTAMDEDPSTADAVWQVRRNYGSRFAFHSAPFAEATARLAPRTLERHEQFDGVMLDLWEVGQRLNLEQQGLVVNDDIFIQDGLLEADVADFLNNSYPELLSYVIYWYGREVQGRALARALLRQRRRAPIRTKFQLASTVRSVGERHYVLFDGIDPAKRVLLAVRAYLLVDRVTSFLAGLKPLLAPDGRIVVCSYHPWLDGIVKNFIDRYTLRSTLPRPAPSSRIMDLPKDDVILLKPIEWLRVLTRVPLSKGQSPTHPGWPRARLRVAERVDPEEEAERLAPKWDF